MKSIVVNRILVLTGFLLLTTGVIAQKPAIDLISSYQQYKHPEAIIDTGKTVNPLVREPDSLQVTPAQTQNLASESEKKRRRQIGPSLDSIFQKEESNRSNREKPPVNISFFFKKYYSLRIFIYITALK